MSTTTDLQLLTQRLADIEPPPAVDWQPLWWTAVAVIACIILAIVIFLRFRRRTPATAIDSRQKALVELAILKSQATSSRESAYRLAAVLRRGFELAQLNHTPPANIEPHDWQTLIKKLEKLRYQSSDSEQLSADELNRVETWLRGKPC